MIEVIKVMNELKSEGFIEEWALGGGIAFNFYNDADRKCLDYILERYESEKYPLRERLREVLKRV